MTNMDALVDRIRRGERRSLARAMSLVDQSGADADSLKDVLRRETGAVPWWGFTGPPGVGKSTLIDTLLCMLREKGRRVGVVAVDPTSPMSDGALLGDRVRMMRHAVDLDVFIRSLATHRREGGLSDATLHCARLLELAQFDPVLIESVGVGQNEVDIASVADICVVMLGPGYGDDIQLIKAGLLEVADVIVVNKCDTPEANRLLAEVRGENRKSKVETSKRRDVETPSACDGSHGIGASPVEVVGIEAKSGKGVDVLLDKLLKLDRTARDAEQRQRYRHRRILGEIRRGAMLACEGMVNRALASDAGEAWVDRLERGEVSLDALVAGLVTLRPNAGDVDHPV